MVKAKFGALALTVLMGLGAVSPLHGVTEAHALNAPVANSAQQKTVVSTTDDSDGVMSYKDKESGKTFVSEDNGASWMSEEDYNNSHPAINYEWWTYDEYKEWLEQEKKTLQEMADEHAMAETSEGSFEWTQEMTDQYIAEYEQTLEDIKNGLLVSKSVNGDDECMTTFKRLVETFGCGYTGAVKPPVRMTGNRESGHKETGMCAAEPPSRRRCSSGWAPVNGLLLFA